MIEVIEAQPPPIYGRWTSVSRTDPHLAATPCYASQVDMLFTDQKKLMDELARVHHRLDDPAEMAKTVDAIVEGIGSRFALTPL